MGLRLSCVLSAAVGGTALALGGATTAFAQPVSSAPEQALSTATPAETTGIGPGDIIVTARRRAERLQDVPVAITAFGSAELQRYSTESLNQVAARTPQLLIGNTGNPAGGTINLRGIGSPTSGPHLDQAVSINIDGIQVSQANILRLGLYDVERVEVLKGPQALFFGKNSPGGIISISSANPADHLEAKLRGGYEFYNEQKYVEGTISGPLTETLGVRLDGYYSDQKGWFRNSAVPIASITIPAALGGGTTGAGRGATSSTAPAITNYFARGTLVYDSPGGFLKANLKLSYGRSTSDNGGGVDNQVFYCVGSAPQYALLLGIPNPGDCKLDRYYNEPANTARIAALPNSVDRPFDRNHQWLAALTLDFQLAPTLTLTSVTGLYRFKQGLLGNFGLNDLSYITQKNLLTQRQFSEEVRLRTTFTGPINFLVGGYYQKAYNGNEGFSFFDNPFTGAFTRGAASGPVLASANNIVYHTEHYSLFGQGIVDITPKLEFTAGLRYSHEEKRVSAVAFPDSFRNDTVQVTINPDRETFKNVSPDFTLTYKPTRNVTVYGAYRYGFKSGGFDVTLSNLLFGNRTVGNSSFDQEKVQGGELGFKGSLADRQITVDLAVYRYRYRGLQLSAFDGITSFRLTNAASAIVKGVELSSEFQPRALAGLSIRGAVAYNPARFGNFRNAPCWTGETPAQGCAFRASAAGVTPIVAGQAGNAQDLSGRVLARSSDWAGSVGGGYDYKLAGDKTLSASLDATYASAYFADTTLDPVTKQKAAWRLNGRVAISGRQWELALIGTNLTQTMRVTRSFVLAGTGGGTGTAAGFRGDQAGTPSLPRTVALQATIRY